jgi:hypothetical protein
MVEGGGHEYAEGEITEHRYLTLQARQTILNSSIMARAMWVELLAFCLLSAGCGRSGTSNVVKAGGTVTYHNQPLPEVTVTFHPEHGRPASGTTDAAGQFTLSTSQRNDGAVVGRHMVSIASRFKAPMPGSHKTKAASPPQSSFPPKYATPSTSGLTANVEMAGPNRFHFDLND